MNLVIVEDKEYLREYFLSLLEQMPETQSVIAYSNAEDAVQAIKSDNYPEVVLMDIDLPGMSGIECVSILKNRCPTIQIIMLTIFENEEKIFQALQAGASGYLLKKTPPDELKKAITDVQLGGSPMSMPIARKVVQMFRHFPAQPEQQEPQFALSERELEILTYLAKGYMYKEIADLFDISVHTVRSHLRKIYDKLHVKTRTEATAKFLHSQ